MTAMPHKEDRPVHLLHPDLAWRHASQRVAWLLEEDETDRRTQVGRHRRQRRRLTRTAKARAWQARHE